MMNGRCTSGVHLPFFFDEDYRPSVKKGKRAIYRGKVIELDVERVKLPHGHVTELEIVHHPGAAAVVPYITRDRIVLIRQYRYAVGQYLFEIPAGKLMKRERPLNCAKRELEEEIGYRAINFHKLGYIYTSPGFCDEVIHIYRAEGLRKTQQCLEASELLEVVEVPVQRIRSMIQSGTIRDAKSIIGLQLAHWASRGSS